MDELESRLLAWAAEYGGGRYDNIGWSSRNLLETLGVHGGFVPDSGGYARREVRTAADEVETAVNEMIRGPLFRAAFILRCEYFTPQDTAMDERRASLRRLGIAVSEAGYLAALDEGKATVRDSLRLTRVRKCA